MFNPLRATRAALVVRGVAAIVFGVVALAWPGITLFVLMIAFGAYVLVDGVLALASGIRSIGGDDTRWFSFLQGIAGVGIGIVALLYPGLTSYVLLVLIAGWALATGVLQFVAAVALRGAAMSSWPLALGGLVSMAFGVLLFVFPVSGALAILWLIGAYGIFFGLVLFYVAYHLQEMRARLADRLGTAEE